MGRKCAAPCGEKVLRSWAQGRRSSPDKTGIKNGKVTWSGSVEMFGHFGGTATGLLRLAGDQLGQSGPGCTRLQGQDMVETGLLQGARGPHGAAGHLKSNSTVYNELYTDKLLPFLCLLSALVTKQIKTLSELHC